MDEVIELLREHNEPIPVPLPLPEMDDLVEVQEQILISLPDEYKEFLLEVSDVVYGKIEPATVTDSSSHTYLPELAAQAWHDGLPREYIPICGVNGDYYCIDEYGEIRFWQGEFTDQEWPSIWHWAKEVWLEM